MTKYFKVGDTVTPINTEDSARGLGMGRSYKVVSLDRHSWPVLDGPAVGCVLSGAVSPDRLKLVHPLCSAPTRTTPHGIILRENELYAAISAYLKETYDITADIADCVSCGGSYGDQKRRFQVDLKQPENPA